MISCWRTRRRLWAYASGALAGPAKAGVSAHLLGCQRCRQEIEATRNLLKAYRDHFATLPDTEQIKRAVLEALPTYPRASREEPAPPSPSAFGRRVPLLWAPAGGLALVAALAFILWAPATEVPRLHFPVVRPPRLDRPIMGTPPRRTTQSPVRSTPTPMVRRAITPDLVSQEEVLRAKRDLQQGGMAWLADAEAWAKRGSVMTAVKNLGVVSPALDPDDAGRPIAVSEAFSGVLNRLHVEKAHRGTYLVITSRDAEPPAEAFELAHEAMTGHYTSLVVAGVIGEGP